MEYKNGPSVEKLKVNLLTPVIRGESVLVCKEVYPEIIRDIKNILRDANLGNRFQQTLSVDDLLEKPLEDLNSLAKESIIITGVDLENKDQDRILGYFRAAKNEAQAKGKPLNQLLTIKPGTSNDVPSWHSCFNWTTNI